MARTGRTRTAVVALCVVAIALGGLLGGGAILYALPLPVWTFLPDSVVRHVSPPHPVDRAQPVALLSLSPSRAPPRS